MVSLVLLNWIYLKVMQNPGGSTAAAVYASESAGVNPTSTPAFTLCCSLRLQPRRCQQNCFTTQRGTCWTSASFCPILSPVCQPEAQH